MDTVFTLLTSIAGWAGWPFAFSLFFLVVLWGYWLLRNHISFLQDYKDVLERRIDDEKMYFPDLVLERYANRHKRMSEELERLTDDLQKLTEDTQKFQDEIEEKEREIEEKKRQIDNVNEQMKLFAQKLNEANTQLYLYRSKQHDAEYKISFIVLQQLLLNIHYFSKIFIPIELDFRAKTQSIDANDMLSLTIVAEPTTKSPVLLLFNCYGAILGTLINPYQQSGVFDMEYSFTLDRLFSIFEQKKDVGGWPTYKLPSSARLVKRDKASLHSSPFEWYLEIQFTKIHFEQILDTAYTDYFW